MTALSPRARIERLARQALRLWAPAKINLNLLVGPRGPDGLHPVDSLVAKITLYDRLDLRLRADGRIGLQCRGADCGPDERNLALQAARALAAGRDVGGADVRLRKNIPPGRGLGGGSSDAAAVLLGLSDLWGLRPADAELAELAGTLGCDVPLFLGTAASRLTGRGENVEPVTIHPFFAVLCIPAFACATAEVYAAYDRQPVAVGQQLDKGLLASRPPSAWRGLLQNQLAPAAGEVCGDLAELRTRLSSAIDLPVCMSGTGSALFVLCDSKAEALAVRARLPEELMESCLIVRRNDW